MWRSREVRYSERFTGRLVKVKGLKEPFAVKRKKRETARERNSQGKDPGSFDVNSRGEDLRKSERKRSGRKKGKRKRRNR